MMKKAAGTGAGVRLVTITSGIGITMCFGVARQT
jgi:hypothetical protein